MSFQVISSQIAGDTTIFHIPGSSSLSDSNEPQNKPSTLLIFLPGNPGFIQYYTHYLSLIHEALKPTTDIEVLGISHAGFEPEVGHCDKVFTLKEQVQHKIEIIEQFLNTEKQRDIWIFGHSVGCYIAQRVLSESDKDSKLRQRLKFIGLITPTIVDIHKSAKGVRMHGVSQIVPNFNVYISKLTYLTSMLPGFALDGLVNYVVRNSTILDSFNVTKKFLTNENTVKQCLGLAIEEMREIQDTWEYNFKFMEDFSHVQKWFFFTHPDSWVSLETQKDIETKLVNEHSKHSCIDRDDEIGHSFCIDRSVEFCEITLRRLNALIAEVRVN
ncbi:hypothetical protein WICPIJ_008090 [Wickerhamomyces pijperi]|uniref:Lipid droplet-associated hydrolase n=1 Tax=Wickerhamomyces pijperi TaxID=599730 RepID=A0A9P8Q0C0_WICPI|nr:hypothetical protein WICPIJ_008090 [Wickerhamomyces pijperi]